MAQKLSNAFLKELMQLSLEGKESIRESLVSNYLQKGSGEYRIAVTIIKTEESEETQQEESITIRSDDPEVGLKYIESLEGDKWHPEVMQSA